MNEKSSNLLPYDGSAVIIDGYLDEKLRSKAFNHLQEKIAWKNDVIKIFGKTIITKRMYAMLAEKKFSYKYSRVNRIAEIWEDDIFLEIKTKIEAICNESFNFCLLNYYPTGAEGMSWHCDNEKELVKNGVICSVSFGSSRKFSFKHKALHTKKDVQLVDGSILIMSGTTQENWLHCLRQSKKIQTPRINLTFRQMVKEKIAFL